MFIGLSIGSNVAIAKAIGERNDEKASRATHTGILVGLISGIIVSVIGLIFTRRLVELMKFDPEVIDKSALYLRIYFLGSPAVLVYNFGASALRAKGDTRRPLVFLTISGITNILLNLLFVIPFNMDVAGVGYATIISQYASATAAILVLIKRKNVSYNFSPRKMGIDKSILKRALRLGIPQGIQGAMFSIANVILVSSMNEFDGYIFTGYTITNQIDAIIYNICIGFSVTCLTFTAQNYGAKNLARVKKVLLTSILLVIASALLTSAVTLVFQEPLTLLFMPENSTNEETILAVARSLNFLVLGTYFLMGVLGVLSGSLRGLGRSVMQSALFLTGLCGTRILWIFAVFPFIKTPIGLMLCFPVSWTVAIILIGTARLAVGKKLAKANAQDTSSPS